MIAQTYAINLDDLASELSCINQINGSVFQHYVIRTEHRDILQKYLFDSGVGSTVHYPAPDYVYTAQDQVSGHSQVLTDTEKACAEVLSLPCYPELNPWEIERICALIKQKLIDGDN
jgi:dTDP-4-amino-4,6-dideoxygalactose transaminase